MKKGYMILGLVAVLLVSSTSAKHNSWNNTKTNNTNSSTNGTNNATNNTWNSSNNSANSTINSTNNATNSTSNSTINNTLNSTISSTNNLTNNTWNSSNDSTNSSINSTNNVTNDTSNYINSTNYTNGSNDTNDTENSTNTTSNTTLGNSTVILIQDYSNATKLAIDCNNHPFYCSGADYHSSIEFSGVNASNLSITIDDQGSGYLTGLMTLSYSATFVNFTDTPYAKETIFAELEGVASIFVYGSVNSTGGNNSNYYVIVNDDIYPYVTIDRNYFVQNAAQLVFNYFYSETLQWYINSYL